MEGSHNGIALVSKTSGSKIPYRFESCTLRFVQDYLHF